MKEKVKKGDVAVVVLILILLVGIIVLSGVFYFNTVTGRLGTTGHIVLNKDSNNLVKPVLTSDKKSEG
jgi:hypothetical protein